jgi:hypothetical protein
MSAANPTGKPATRQIRKMRQAMAARPGGHTIDEADVVDRPPSGPLGGGEPGHLAMSKTL